ALSREVRPVQSIQGRLAAHGSQSDIARSEDARDCVGGAALDQERIAFFECIKCCLKLSFAELRSTKFEGRRGRRRSAVAKRGASQPVVACSRGGARACAGLGTVRSAAKQWNAQYPSGR